MKNNYKGFVSMSAMVDHCLQEIYKSKGLALKKIIYHWDKIVGEHLSAYTLPYKISLEKRTETQKRTMHIFVTNGAFSSQLFYMSNIILEKIASYVGSHYIDLLRLDLKPSLSLNHEIEEDTYTSVTIPEVAIDGIEDNSLKHSLQALGQVILTKRK